MTWLIGIKAIAEYMGWNHEKVMRMHVKYGFPLIRLPVQKRQHWAYATTDQRIALWFEHQTELCREHVLSTRTGKRLYLRDGRQPAAPTNANDANVQQASTPDDASRTAVDGDGSRGEGCEQVEDVGRAG